MHLNQPKMPHRGCSLKGFYLFECSSGEALVIEDNDGTTVILPSGQTNRFGREFVFIWPSGITEKLNINSSHYYRKDRDTPLMEAYLEEEKRYINYAFCEIRRLKHYELANMELFGLKELKEDNAWPSIGRLCGSIGVEELSLIDIGWKDTILIKTFLTSQILIPLNGRRNCPTVFNSYLRNANGKIVKKEVSVMGENRESNKFAINHYFNLLNTNNETDSYGLISAIYHLRG